VCVQKLQLVTKALQRMLPLRKARTNWHLELLEQEAGGGGGGEVGEEEEEEDEAWGEAGERDLAVAQRAALSSSR
jgi:hypothetical protein